MTIRIVHSAEPAFHVRRLGPTGREHLKGEYKTTELMQAIVMADLMKEEPAERIELFGSTIPDGVFQFMVKIVENQE